MNSKFRLSLCIRLVEFRTYAPTGNRDLERDFLSHSLFSRLIAPTLRSGISIAFAVHSVDRSFDGVGTGIKLQHDEPTFPKQIDRLSSYEFSKVPFEKGKVEG